MTNTKTAQQRADRYARVDWHSIVATKRDLDLYTHAEDDEFITRGRCERFVAGEWEVVWLVSDVTGHARDNFRMWHAADELVVLR